MAFNIDIQFAILSYVQTAPASSYMLILERYNGDGFAHVTEMK